MRREEISEWLVLLDNLTNTLFFITQGLFDHKEKIEYHQRELESKLYRFGMANHSIIQCIKGVRFSLLDLKEKRTEIDFFSMYSLMRQQIESFINLFYLVFDDVDLALKDLRYDVYKLHGLLKQSQMDVKSDFGKIMKQEILNEIDETRNRIKLNSIFKEADSKEKNKLLAPRYSKLEKSENLFERSDIARLRLREMWSLYSNYAHAEYISDRQFHFLKDKNNQGVLKTNIISTLSQLSQLTTILINFMIETFQSSKIVYNNLEPNRRVLVEIWNDLIEKERENKTNTNNDKMHTYQPNIP